MSFAEISGDFEKIDARTRTATVIERPIRDGFHSGIDFLEEQMRVFERQLTTQIRDLESIQREIDIIRHFGRISKSAYTQHLNCDSIQEFPIAGYETFTYEDDRLHDVLKQMHRNLAERNSSTQNLKLDLVRLKTYVDIHNLGRSNRKFDLYGTSGAGHSLEHYLEPFGRNHTRYSVGNHSESRSDILANESTEENRLLRQCLNDIRGLLKRSLNDVNSNSDSANAHKDIRSLKDAICKDLEKLIHFKSQIGSSGTSHKSYDHRKQAHLKPTSDDSTNGYFELTHDNPESDIVKVTATMIDNQPTIDTSATPKHETRSLEAIKSAESDDSDNHSQDSHLNNGSLKSELVLAQKQLEMFQTKIFEAIQLVYDVEMEVSIDQDLVGMVVAVAEECNALRKEVSYLRKLRQGMKESCAKLLEYVLDAEKLLEMNGRDINTLREVVDHFGNMVDSSECTTIEETFLYLYSNQLEWMEKLNSSLEKNTEDSPTSGEEGADLTPLLMDHESKIETRTISTQTSRLFLSCSEEFLENAKSRCDKSVQHDYASMSNDVGYSYPFDLFASEPVNREIYVVHESDEELDSNEVEDKAEVVTDVDYNDHDTVEKQQVINTSTKVSDNPKVPNYLLGMTWHRQLNREDKKSDDAEYEIEQSCYGQIPQQKKVKRQVDASERFPKNLYHSKRKKYLSKKSSFLFPPLLPVCNNESKLSFNDFALTMIGDFISLHLGILGKKLPTTEVNEQFYEKYFRKHDLDLSNFGGNGIFEPNSDFSKEENALAGLGLHNILSLDSDMILKVIEHFYFFHKHYNESNRLKSPDRLFNIVNEKVSSNQYIMLLPYLIPLALKMIQKFERAFGAEMVVNIVNNSDGPRRCLSYKPTNVFPLNFDNTCVKSLVLSESDFKTKRSIDNNYSEMEFVISTFLATMKDSGYPLGSNYLLCHEFPNSSSVSDSLRKCRTQSESYHKVLDVLIKYTDRKLPIFDEDLPSTYLLIEKEFSTVILDFNNFPETVVFTKTSSNHTFQSHAYILTFERPFTATKTAPDCIENGQQFYLNKIGECHITKGDWNHLKGSNSLLKPIFEILLCSKFESTTITVLDIKTKQICNVESMETQLDDVTTLSEEESSVKIDNYNLTLTMSDCSVQTDESVPVFEFSQSINKYVQVDDCISDPEISELLNIPSEEEVFPNGNGSEFVKDSVEAGEPLEMSEVEEPLIFKENVSDIYGEQEKPSVQLANTEQQDLLRNLTDEITALKENLEQQNAVLRRLKECCEEAGQNILLKDEQIMELQRQTFFLNAKLDEAENNKYQPPAVTDGIVQTEIEDIKRFDRNEQELECLKLERELLLEKISRHKKAGQKIKQELVRTVLHLVALKATASTQLQKQKLQQVKVIQAKQQLQDAEDIISKLRRDSEAGNRILNLQFVQPIDSIGSLDLNVDETKNVEEGRSEDSEAMHYEADNGYKEIERKTEVVPNEENLSHASLCELLIELLKKLDRVECVFSCKCQKGGSINHLESEVPKCAIWKNILNDHGQETDVIQLLAISEQAYHSLMDKISSTLKLNEGRKSRLSSLRHSSISDDLTDTSREQSSESSEKEIQSLQNMMNSKNIGGFSQDFSGDNNTCVVKKKAAQFRSSTARYNRRTDRNFSFQRKVPLELKNAQLLMDDKGYTAVKT